MAWMGRREIRSHALPEHLLYISSISEHLSMVLPSGRLGTDLPLVSTLGHCLRRSGGDARRGRPIETKIQSERECSRISVRMCQRMGQSRWKEELSRWIGTESGWFECLRDSDGDSRMRSFSRSDDEHEDSTVVRTDETCRRTTTSCCFIACHCMNVSVSCSSPWKQRSTETFVCSTCIFKELNSRSSSSL